MVIIFVTKVQMWPRKYTRQPPETYFLGKITIKSYQLQQEIEISAKDIIVW